MQAGPEGVSVEAGERLKEEGRCVRV